MLNNCKKIIVIGDAGRGKTTFAEKLSEKLGIPKYSTDDYYWETKFSKARSVEESNEMARQCFEKDAWIVEGGSRRMLRIGLPKADRIFYLNHKSFLHQVWVICKRSYGRENETLKNTFDLIVYQFKKRNKIGKHKNVESFEDMISPYEDKIVKINSFKEIDDFLEKI